MAVLFSAVTVTAGNEEAELLVGGIPREYDDLEGWTIFEDFLAEISEETQVNIHAEAYLYGAEETYQATPEEVAYFMKRMEMDENFLRDRLHRRCGFQLSVVAGRIIWNGDALK